MSVDDLLQKVKDEVMETGADEFGAASVNVSDETLVPLRALRPLAEAVEKLERRVHKLARRVK